MARVTVERTLDKVDSRFELVVLTAYRAHAIYCGSQTLVNANDKYAILALREVESGKLDIEKLRDTVIRKYAIAPENEVVTGYLVQYWENEKVVKSIQSRLTPSKTHTFSFHAEGTVDTQVVTVPGMDEALWITRNGKTSLKMIRKLEQPVTVKAAPESSLGEFDGTIAYGYELITVNNFTFDECEQYFQVAIP